MERFEPGIYSIWNTANELAWASNAQRIETAHIFLSLLMFLEGIPADIVRQFDFRSEEFAALNGDMIRCKEILDLADSDVTAMRRKMRRAIMTNPVYEPAPGLLHRSQESKKIFNLAEVAAVQESRKIRPSDLLEALLPYHKSGQFQPESIHFDHRPTPERAVVDQTSGGKFPNQAGLLERIGRDLTAEARAGRLPPVVGRVREMTEIARILSRTTKRNVILLGEAGVGKTAVVEGLALRIADGQVPSALKDLRICQLNVADLVAGTHYRGEMEQRLKAIIDEVTRDPNLVLFIDEIHLVAKSGTISDSAMDVANILKPALARSDFRCIGATTVSEYQRYLVEDAAFKRRFSTLMIDEPSEEEAIEIASAWAERISASSELKFSPDAIETAVRLSHELIPERKLPDAAIDLLENAYASLRIQDFDSRDQENVSSQLLVTPKTIHSVLERQYKIAITRFELLDIRRIQQNLEEKLIGQDKAIIQIMDALSILSLRSARHTTLGTIMFIGPASCGKATAASCIAAGMNGGRGASVLEINLAEYQDRYSLTRLIGAPPGLIGHDRQGPLFQFAETHRQGVILLKNFSTAHEEVQDALVSIIERGQGADSRGVQVDFRQQLFILTCIREAEREPLTSADQGTYTQVIADGIRPGVLACIDYVIPFQQLNEMDMRALVHREIQFISKKLGIEKPIVVQIDDSSFSNLLLTLNTSGGVRPFLSGYEKQVLMPVARFLVNHPDEKKIRLLWSGNQVSVVADIEPDSLSAI